MTFYVEYKNPLSGAMYLGRHRYEVDKVMSLVPAVAKDIRSHWLNGEPMEVSRIFVLTDMGAVEIADEDLYEHIKSLIEEESR